MVVDEHGVALDMLNFLQEFLDGEPELPLDACRSGPNTTSCLSPLPVCCDEVDPPG